CWMPVHEGLRMKVWYDACTGKQVRYGVAIARRLREKGHETILTTRKHPDTLPLAEFLGENFHVVGKYDPKSLLTRVKEGVRRQLFFCSLFEKDVPDVAISHGSVDLCRVAFGLGIPIITTIDTLYADAVNKLTLPLSNYVVASKAIPKGKLKAYIPKGNLISFEGVDEVAWIKGFVPSVSFDFGESFVVVREFEEKASYTKRKIDFWSIAKKLTKFGKVIFLSRYKRKITKDKDIIVPKEFIDSASLVAQADLFVGAGGTITREAALQGTPSIVIDVLPKQHANDFLAKRGFPIFKTDTSKVLKFAERLFGKKYEVKFLLDKLENPVDIIERIINEID
ncbi:MAG: DUF354 domain-containing protein, partial [Candidatus Bathycorpusculaceae bacterium]